MTPKVLRLAAFSDGDTGGNPAGVVVAAQHPSPEEMQRIAAAGGFSETSFAQPMPRSETGPRGRYFSPAWGGARCGAGAGAGAAEAVRHGAGHGVTRSCRAQRPTSVSGGP